MPEDSDLLVRLRNGDGDALRRLYDRHKHDLLTVATCLLADAPAAEDVLHDVFVALAASAGRLRIRGSLRSYLVACVANRARDQYRRRVRQEVTLDDIEVSSAEVEPIRAAMDGEDTERLRQAMLRRIHAHYPDRVADRTRRDAYPVTVRPRSSIDSLPADC